MKKEFVIKITAEELNIVLNGIAQLPYGQVFSLIASIQEQARNQVNEKDDG